MRRQGILAVCSVVLFTVLTIVLLSGTQVDAVTRSARLALAPTKPTPTPVPGAPRDPANVGDQAVQRPDLVIKSIEVLPASPYVFGNATIKVTIRNEGPGIVTATNNFYVDLYIRGPVPPDSNERGIDTHGDTSQYDVALPWGVQGFWVGAVGAEHVLTCTAVFTQVKSYFLYAQIDTPEEDSPESGRVYENPPEGELNNVYPTNSSVQVQTRTPGRATQSKYLDFYDNYASTLDVLPGTHVITDIVGNQITSDAMLALGRFEEPPLDWGTNTIPPDYLSDDYNIKYPDQQMNTDTTRNQTKPVIATDGTFGGQNAVTVWQDHRAATEKPDIYLRWSSGEVNVGDGKWRQNWGVGAAHELRVNDDPNPTAAAQRNPAVAVASNGDVVVVWQDNRLNPGDQSYWDIYLQQYQFAGGALNAIGGNVRVQTSVAACPTANESSPDVAVDVDNWFYVSWLSQCTEQAAIWAVKGRSLSLGAAITWDPGRYVADPSAHNRLDPKIDVAPASVISITAVDVSDPLVPIVYWDVVTKTIVVATWYEDRGLGTGQDIFVTYNDNGMTGEWGEQRKVNDDGQTAPARAKQDQPKATITQDKVDCTIYAQGVEINLTDVPVPALHVVWRDYRNSTHAAGADPDTGNNPDIYYGYGPFIPDPNSPYLPDLTIGPEEPDAPPNVKLNRDDNLPWRPSDTPFAQQAEPDIAGHSYYDYWNDAREIPYDVYAVWSDDRNYPNGNYDLYMWMYGDNFDQELMLENIHLTDDVKIHDYNAAEFENYGPDRPPPARQTLPSVSVTLEHNEAEILGGYIWTAWADNRFSPNAAANNEVFVSRTNLTFVQNYDTQDYGDVCQSQPFDGYGAYVSKALDSGQDDTTWYKLEYYGRTYPHTYAAIQTRVANSVSELMSTEWWPQYLHWEEGPFGCKIPVRGYVESGAYLQQNGNPWPQGRYAQYRVNMWTADSKFSPELYYVTLYHGAFSSQGSYGDVYLPSIMLQEDSKP